LSHIGKKELVNAKSVTAISEGSILRINKLHSFTAELLLLNELFKPLLGRTRSRADVE